MTTEQIKSIQRKLGVRDDGVWGVHSEAACKTYLRGLKPNPNPWPSSDVQSLTRFYGSPGDESNLVSLEFPFRTFYAGRPVARFRCHKKVADSLSRILHQLRDLYGSNTKIMDPVSDYGGCFNFRPKRGGNSWSLHAWGAAIDLDADDNTFRDPWPQKSDMPFEVMEVFAREGWVCAGGEWGYDAMHFQATR